VVLDDPSVSRKHARVQRTSVGLKVTDLGSGNGVWVGEERVTETVLEDGQQFQIGSAVFTCLTDAAVEAESQAQTVLIESPVVTAETEPASGEAESFVLRVVEWSDGSQPEQEFLVQGREATIGRDAGCTVMLSDRTVSRKHAKVEVTPQGFRIVSLGSKAGVWVDKSRVEDAQVVAGQRVHLGSYVVIECHLAQAAERVEGEVEADGTRQMSVEQLAAPAPPEPGEGEVEADGTRQMSVEQLAALTPVAEPPAGATVVMPASPQLVEDTRPIQEEGELVEVSAHRPFLLDDASSVWYVVSGGIEIFTVAVEHGAPVGTRAHFLGVLPGQCFFGFDLLRYGMGSGFLAVAKRDTTVRRIRLARLRALASARPTAAAVAALIDTWIAGLSKTLTRDLDAKRVGESTLQSGEPVELASGGKATAAEGVLWIDIWSGSILFDDLATPMFDGKRTLFPICPDSWIQPVSEEFGDLSLKPLRTVETIADPMLWQGLEVFHQVLCECEFINKKLSAVDEFVRLQEKAEYKDAAKEAAYDAIGSVLRSEAATPRVFLETGGAEPVLRACQLVGDAIGLEVKAHPTVDEDLTYEEQIAALASISGFRTRVVALRDQWWTEDHGPFLAQVEETKTPVAILPTGPRSYECVDPKTGASTKIDEAVAASLAGFAYAFYAPFPDGSLKVGDVVRFGARGLLSEFRLLVMMGIIVGLLGTVTPYVTGQIFDSAIPQADRGMLFVFGLGLFATALGTSMFKLTQGIATVRVQGKMEYVIQSALWDRLLNLPANFFRKYSAGDLSDRVAGVDAIQTLVSGAGVAAILGSFSGLFYVVLMFTYNLRLALLAIALTICFVGVTTLANYAQLRHQRREIQFRGKITGLVLNLITGVTKLRICGAEHHAFRVWAQQFSEQRKLSFTIGTIQNVVAVFTSIFPIISSIAIFSLMLFEQQRAAETGTPGLTTGDFIAFNAAYGLFLAAMQAMGDASLNLLRVVPIYERLKPVMTTPAEVDSSKAYPGRLQGEMELSHVHFRYDENGPWVVHDLSLKIEAGECVAFVGGSGCGKSTLMRLMLGFEQPTMGSVYYDGQDLGLLDSRLVRQQMGVVLQVSRVMPTEVYRNIIGISSRTIEDAWAAAEMAGLSEDIQAMPMGMHTYVSEGGGTLSGGQRQRLLIARAVVNKPKVIFFDEATSALDNRAQAKVTESMDKMDATRIVIAHRLSTVVNADKICYLEGGKIVEMGTYAELMAQDGLFAALAKRQMA
jgi:NHLM bacteriocin system ABC transporter ATP-binding protein